MFIVWAAYDDVTGLKLDVEKVHGTRLKQVRFEWSGLMLPQLDDDNEMHFIPWLIYPLPLIFLVFALSKPFLKMIREDHVNIKRALMVNMAWLYLSMIFSS